MKPILLQGCPLTLSTDDEGVSRIDLTHEYTRATRTYDLGYPVLKQFARNSLSYAFLSGDSLWDNAATGMLIEACRKRHAGGPVAITSMRRISRRQREGRFAMETGTGFHPL